MPSPALRRRGVRRPARPTPRQLPAASPAGGTAPIGSSESTCPSRPRSRRARQGGSGAGRRGRAAAGRKWARSRRTVRCGAAGPVGLLPAGGRAVAGAFAVLLDSEAGGEHSVGELAEELSTAFAAVQRYGNCASHVRTFRNAARLREEI